MRPWRQPAFSTGASAGVRDDSNGDDPTQMHCVSRRSYRGWALGALLPRHGVASVRGAVAVDLETSRRRRVRLLSRSPSQMARPAEPKFTDGVSSASARSAGTPAARARLVATNTSRLAARNELEAEACSLGAVHTAKRRARREQRMDREATDRLRHRVHVPATQPVGLRRGIVTGRTRQSAHGIDGLVARADTRTLDDASVAGRRQGNRYIELALVVATTAQTTAGDARRASGSSQRRGFSMGAARERGDAPWARSRCALPGEAGVVTAAATTMPAKACAGVSETRDTRLGTHAGRQPLRSLVHQGRPRAV